MMAAHDPPPGAFRVRLYFPLSSRIEAPGTQWDFMLLGHLATLTAQYGESIRDADWLALVVSGFETEVDARDFGDRLTRAFSLAAVQFRIGTDIGDPEVGRADAGIWIAPITGIAVGHVSPEVFFDQVEFHFSELLEQRARIDQATRLLSLALLAKDDLARMILAISAVEHLAPPRKWTSGQKEIRGKLGAMVLEMGSGLESDRQEIARSVSKSEFRPEVGIAIDRLLSERGLTALIKPWRETYRVRSRIVHGSHDLAELARHSGQAVRLAGRIVLTVAGVPEIVLDETYPMQAS